MEGFIQECGDHIVTLERNARNKKKIKKKNNWAETEQ